VLVKYGSKMKREKEPYNPVNVNKELYNPAT
jgi:hypothetical protein